MRIRFLQGKSALLLQLKNTDVLLSHGESIAVRRIRTCYVLDILNAEQTKHLNTFLKETDTIIKRDASWFAALKLSFVNVKN